MNILKAIFAITSDKDRALLLEHIPIENAPTPDTFPSYAGIMLVVATQTTDSVYWVIDNNPYVELIPTEDENIFHIIKSEHAAHLKDIHACFKQVAIEMGVRVKAPNPDSCPSNSCAVCTT